MSTRRYRSDRWIFFERLIWIPVRFRYFSQRHTHLWIFVGPSRI
jgi:hypothetical protein